jgi:hypothetical protein
VHVLGELDRLVQVLQRPLARRDEDDVLVGDPGHADFAEPVRDLLLGLAQRLVVLPRGRDRPLLLLGAFLPQEPAALVDVGVEPALGPDVLGQPLGQLLGLTTRAGRFTHERLDVDDVLAVLRLELVFVNGPGIVQRARGGRPGDRQLILGEGRTAPNDRGERGRAEFPSHRDAPRENNGRAIADCAK